PDLVSFAEKTKKKFSDGDECDSHRVITPLILSDPKCNFELFDDLLRNELIRLGFSLIIQRVSLMGVSFQISMIGYC
ncbi:hypothetical protein AALP_AAs46949U000100, partial [Arabis alpina]